MEQSSLLNEQPEQYSLCLRVRGQLQDYIEGYLDEVARETVRAHLAVCAMCHREYYEMRETIRLIETLPYMTPARDLSLSIMSSISPRRRSLWQMWRPKPPPR